MKDNGRQFKVKPGDNIWVDLKKETNVGDSIEFDNILVYSKDDDVRIGKPLVPDVKVVGQVEGNKKSKKLTIMKFRRRKDSRTKNGHRQNYTEISIKDIVNGNSADSNASEEFSNEE